MLITRKSLVVHEFPARVCCGGVLWVSVPSGVVGCGSVWLLHVSLYVYCIPHTHPIWPPVTFSSSPSWSFGWRVEDSTPLKRFKRNRSGYLTQFQKGTSRDASKHCRNVGTAVFVQKGSTLKVMEEFNIQGKQTSFYKYCPGTFGYTLVYLVYRTSHFLNDFFR